VAKKLACRLGRHDWTTRVEEGESYKVCAACGKTAPDSPRPGSGPREPHVPANP
jgi:hypothetical protein